jgi:hypothetical protein
MANEIWEIKKLILGFESQIKEFNNPSDTIKSGPLEINIERGTVNNGNLIYFRVENVSNDVVTLNKIDLYFDISLSKVLETGFQGWSQIRVASIDDCRPERKKNSVKWMIDTYEMDSSSRGDHVTCDHYLLGLGDTGYIMGALSAFKNFTTFRPYKNHVTVSIMLDSVTLLGGAIRETDPIFMSTGDPGELYSLYVELWARTSKARNQSKSDLGWSSWYHYFSDITPVELKSNIDIAIKSPIEVFQLDDGFQKALGDWLRPCEKFNDYYPHFAKDKSLSDLSKGIWTAPFLVTPAFYRFQEFEQCLLNDDQSELLTAMYSPSWGGAAYAIDTTHPLIKDFLTETYSRLVEYGFDFFKIDFCYAAALSAKRHDTQKTRAEALRLGLELIRNAIGDSSFLLGCGCPFGPAVGLVDAMRVSPDTAPYWEPRMNLFGYLETAVCAKNAILASIYRSPFHRRLFINDPDCLMLRQTQTFLTRDQIECLKASILACGAFVMLSDDLSLYNNSTWKELDRLINLKSNYHLDSKITIQDPFSDPIKLISSDTATTIRLNSRTKIDSGAILGAATNDYFIEISKL